MVVRFYIAPIVKSAYTHQLLQIEQNFRDQMNRAFRERTPYIGRELVMIYQAFLRLNDALSDSAMYNHFILELKYLNKVIDANRMYNLNINRFIDSIDEDWDLVGLG